MVWFGETLGVFHGFDRILYDRQTQYSYARQVKSIPVVIIEASASFRYSGATDWFNTIQLINELKPRAIVLPDQPHAWSLSETEQALQKFPLMIGDTRVVADREALPLFAGNTILPPVDGSGYRQQWLMFESDRGQGKSLELAVAENIANYRANSQQDKFYIDFRNAGGRIPIIEMDRLLKGELIESLIKDSVVLMGYVDPLLPQLSTPIGVISFSLYQAHALDTLLNSNEIYHLNFVAMMLVTTLMVFVLLILLPRISEKYQLFSFVLMVFLTLLFSWFMLSVADVWILTGTLLITEIAVFVMLYYERNRQHTMQLRKMALKSTASVEHRWLPQNFYTSEEHWTQIANMVSQTFSLNRTIFLERVKGEHRVTEIKALNCSLDDINEMRRDYHRKPYTLATDTGGVVKLDSEYLANPDEGEVQYLAPLNFAGEVLGFWALGLKEIKPAEENKMLYAIQQFSMQIAEMLYHREQWLVHKTYQDKPWVKLMNLQFDERPYASINRAINFLSQRLIVMESVMDGMETSAVVYDLFGRVVQTNDSMSDLLSSVDLAPYSMTAADLISQLTSCNLTDARDYLSYVILDKGTISLPVNYKKLNRGYMLSVRGLSNKGDSVPEDGDVRPFEIIGILCELTDTTHISEIYGQKEEMIEQLTSCLRNDLSSISIACDLAIDTRSNPDNKMKLLNMVKDKVGSLGSSVVKVNEIMQSDLVVQKLAHYPVESKKPLLSVIELLKKEQKKNVRIQTEFPFHLPLVLASPSELKTTYEAILKLLYSDVVEDGKINIKIIHRSAFIEYEFSNEGFGMPNEQLQSYINNEDMLQTDEFKMLRTIKHQVIDWGGKFEAYSALGEGIKFKLYLESFQIHEQEK